PGPLRAGLRPVLGSPERGRRRERASILQVTLLENMHDVPFPSLQSSRIPSVHFKLSSRRFSPTDQGRTYGDPDIVKTHFWDHLHASELIHDSPDFHLTDG